MSRENESPSPPRHLLKQLPRLPEADTIHLFRDGEWIMSLGERAALVGILSQVKPTLALEIGVGAGGSLRRLAAYSDEVHEIDIKDPLPPLMELGNVHWHTGDSHEVLPQLLATFAEQGRNIDFALIDGDHSSEAARRDMENLLDSPATSRTVILAHDTMNEDVRSGLEQIAWDRISKVSYVDLDFVPGYMFRGPGWRYQLWGGFGLIIVDEAHSGNTLRQDHYYEIQPLMQEMKQVVMQREASEDMHDGARAPAK
jgi:Methyltransferase domain